MAGAALLGTFLTSIVGIFLQPPAWTGRSCRNAGLVSRIVVRRRRFAGMYIAARLQKYVPQKFIKLMLGAMIVSLSLKYILEYLAR